MSDGGRGRASLGVKVWKSSQKWSVQRSAVRSIAWLDRSRGCYMELGYCASRRVETDPVLFASNRKRNVPKLLHRLSIVPIYLVLRLPRSFVRVLEQDTIRAAHDLQNVLLGVATLDALPWMNVTPVLILDHREPRHEQSERNPYIDAGNSKRALHDLTRHKISDRVRHRAWLQGGRTNYTKATHRSGAWFAASSG
jgi:hypothetical protein